MFEQLGTIERVCAALHRQHAVCMCLARDPRWAVLVAVGDATCVGIRE